MPRPTVEFLKSECVKATKMALCCVIDGEETWIPLSQVADESEVCAEGDTGTLVVFEWFAKEKGLV